MTDTALEANIRKLLTDLTARIITDRGHTPANLDNTLIDQAASLLAQVIEAAETGANK